MSGTVLRYWTAVQESGSASGAKQQLMFIPCRITRASCTWHNEAKNVYLPVISLIRLDACFGGAAFLRGSELLLICLLKIITFPLLEAQTISETSFEML